MLLGAARQLGTALLLLCTLDACAAQGYYGYNPYYPYHAPAAYSRRPTSAPATAVSAYYRRANAARRPPNANRSPQLTNPYATYNKRGASTTGVTALSDAYRRRPAVSGTTTKPATKYHVSKADAENAKFVGAANQEANEGASKTLFHLNRRRGNRCSPFGRQSDGGASSTSSTPKEQGRFLWDLNVYNVYAGVPGGGGYFSDAQQSPYGCGGGGFGGGFGGGGGLGGALGGLLSDPYDGGGGYAPPSPPLNNFLSLFAPGILQNALAATVPPPPAPPLQGDPTGTDDYQNDPAVDPNYGRPPVRRPPPVPNRIYFDNPGAAPITPAQLVGGVATTVNGIIQQLTGSVQPVYPGYG